MNTILIRTPIGIRTKVEWCYLLGAFGVSVAGTEKKITTLPEKLGYSSVTSQGLPFYTGNIEYDQKITTPDCDLTVKVSEYRGALIRVFLDGEDKGVIAFDPFTLDLGHVTAGEHTITLRCYGTRYNAFRSAAQHRSERKMGRTRYLAHNRRQVVLRVPPARRGHPQSARVNNARSLNDAINLTTDIKAAASLSLRQL